MLYTSKGIRPGRSFDAGQNCNLHLERNYCNMFARKKPKCIRAHATTKLALLIATLVTIVSTYLFVVATSSPFPYDSLVQRANFNGSFPVGLCRSHTLPHTSSQFAPVNCSNCAPWYTAAPTPPRYTWPFSPFRNDSVCRTCQFRRNLH